MFSTLAMIIGVGVVIGIWIIWKNKASLPPED